MCSTVFFFLFFYHVYTWLLFFRVSFWLLHHLVPISFSTYIYFFLFHLWSPPRVCFVILCHYGSILSFRIKMTCARGCSNTHTHTHTLVVTKWALDGRGIISEAAAKNPKTCKVNFKILNWKWKKNSVMENRIKNTFNEYICQFKLEIGFWITYKMSDLWKNKI